MERVLFITYYWPPSGGAGVQRGLKFVKYLPEFGVAPIVLTVDPDRASYPVLDPSLAAEVRSDLRVVRTDSFEPLRWLAAVAGKKAVPHAGFAGAKDGVVQRIMRWVRGNLMLPDARRGWVKYAVEAATGIIQAERIGTIVITSPPHSSQLIGLRLKERFPHLRWVADMRDPWTDIYFAKELLKGRCAERIDAQWEERVLRGADAVVVVGPSTKATFAERYGPEVAQRITVIPNGYDRSDIEGIAAPIGRERFRITYVGTMAASYAPQAFFAAVAGLKGEGMPIDVRFVGSVAPEVREMAAAAGVDALCLWIPSVPHDEALHEMAGAHLLLIATPHGEGEERVIPGKLFEYLGVRRPIIGLGPPNGDVAAILVECGAGRMFERHMVDELRNHIKDAMDRVRAGDDLRVQGDASLRYERRAAAQALAGLITAGHGAASA